MPMVLHPDPRAVIEDDQDKIREQEELEEKKRLKEEEDLIITANKLEQGDNFADKIGNLKQPKKAEDEESNKNTSYVDDQSVKPGESSKDFSSKKPSISGKEDGQESEKVGLSEDKKSDSDLDEGEESESEEDESESGISDKKDDTIEEPADLPSAEEMKKELIAAIREALEERDQLKRKNQDLQREIITMDSTYEQYDKQPDVSMNEHKYLNTLANVHQVRFNLKETQDRYNKMATELQAKLNEKQGK